MQQLAAMAYGQVQKRTADNRQIEAALFAQINQALKEHADRQSPAEWADAVHRNQQLWSTLAADLLSPENKLPADLRSSLLTLANFVRQHSLLVLEGVGEIDDLIDINETILAGLEGQVAPEADAA